MSGIFETSEEVQRARDDMHEKLADDIENITLKYGKQATAKALRKFYGDYSRNRVVNSYPISDQEYEQLKEITEGRQVSLAGKSMGDMVEAISNWYSEQSDERKEALWLLYRDYGDAVIYAYCDLTFYDLFVEERDEYIETATTALIELMEDNREQD